MNTVFVGLVNSLVVTRVRYYPLGYLLYFDTLLHPENDRDVTERVQEYTLQGRILYASIPVFLFERGRKHTSCAGDDKCLPPEYALTSRSVRKSIGYQLLYVKVVVTSTEIYLSRLSH